MKGLKGLKVQGKSFPSQITAKDDSQKKKSPTGRHLFARQDKKLENVLQWLVLQILMTIFKMYMSNDQM
jgi:hypothetical protein